jgi:hypothetical protein
MILNPCQDNYIFPNIKTFKLQDVLYVMPEKESKRESVFIVSITGRNTNFEVPINSLADFEDLEGILDILKKKLGN